MRIEDIETDFGAQVLKNLISDGWRVISEYDKNAFDKGIDFDSYRIYKNGEHLEFEWDNWTEWKISGSEKEIDKIKEQYFEWKNS